MNKRMATHLIGLGLVGLSATSWAADGWGLGTLAGTDGEPVMAQVADEGIQDFMFENILVGQKIKIDSKTAFSFAKGDLDHAMLALAASDQGDLEFYLGDDSRRIFAALKGGIAEGTLKKEGWKESPALGTAFKVVQLGISFKYASDRKTALSYMDAGQDSILVDKAIDRSTLEKLKYSTGYLIFRDDVFTLIVKDGIVREGKRARVDGRSSQSWYNHQNFQNWTTMD